MSRRMMRAMRATRLTPVPVDQGDPSSWTGVLSGFLTPLIGLSAFASVFNGSANFDALTLIILGTLIEVGRRLCRWFFERFQPQMSISAVFQEGDPTYDWILLLLTKEKVWQRARNFRVLAKSSRRQWAIEMPEKRDESSGKKQSANAEYVPTYDLPQIFRWNGYWVETSRTNIHMSSRSPVHYPPGQSGPAGTIFLTIYTWKVEALSQLVEAARLRYLEVSSPHVIVHSADSPDYGPNVVWSDVKRKARRPLTSIVLENGVLDILLRDAREFMAMEEWYIDAGIPHRRGYLLHGPPGTGKSSTIYALAGELGMEIYSLSLASDFVDDSYLQRAASSIPKNSIFLIEDIDCAFPSREDDDEPQVRKRSPMMPTYPMYPGMPGISKSRVTLSGLLNVLDGVGSEEGKLFFATTNHIDRLDPALLRPGRVDLKFEYNLATKTQAAALFLRFYPPNRIDLLRSIFKEDEVKDEKYEEKIVHLSKEFGEAIPEHEFSTAELQGYLLGYKKEPQKALEEVSAWVNLEREQRAEIKRKEEERKAKMQQSFGPPSTQLTPPIQEFVAVQSF